MPGSPMPETAEEEDQENVEEVPGSSMTVSSQRDVDVIREPARQRPVPSPPEIAGALSQERTVKILAEPDSEEPRRPDRDVRVPGEIRINLETEQDSRRQCHRSGSQRSIKESAYIGRKEVRDDDLLEKAPQNIEGPFPAGASVRSGAGNQLRQQG